MLLFLGGQNTKTKRVLSAAAKHGGAAKYRGPRSHRHGRLPDNSVSSLNSLIFIA